MYLKTQDEFIFQTVQPYCENIAEMRITKDELKRAMMLLRQQEPVEPVRTPETFHSMFSCGNCTATVGFHMRAENRWRFKFKYCPNCGRKVKWDD